MSKTKKSKKKLMEELADSSSPVLLTTKKQLLHLLLLRRLMSLTGTNLTAIAGILGCSPVNVSKMVSRNDIKLSVLEKIFAHFGLRFAIEFLRPEEKDLIHIDERAWQQFEYASAKRLSFLNVAIEKYGYNKAKLGQEMKERMGKGGRIALRYHLTNDDMHMSWVYLYADIMGAEPYFTILLL